MKTENTKFAAFAAVCLKEADASDSASLRAALAVAAAAFEAGGTNKAALRGLFASLPEGLAERQGQAHRILGGLCRQVAPEGASDDVRAKAITEIGAQVRAALLPSKGQTTAQAVKAALAIASAANISSARALLDAVAPRGEPKKTAKKTAVETFLAAAKADDFKEDVTAVLAWACESHLKTLAAMVKAAEADFAAKVAEAAEKDAAAAAAKAEKDAAKAEKDAAKAAKDAAKAEKTAQVEKTAQDAKSAKAKQEQAEKQARDRAMHPKVRQIIEA